MLVLHEKAKTLEVGLGLKGMLVEQRWWRIFLHLEPELLLIWRPEASARADLAFHAGLGYEYVFMWGAGVVIELYGAAPVGLGDAAFLDGASAGATVGLLMEF